MFAPNFVLTLKNISLYQFRNYRQNTFDFGERVIGICGNNGTGKTNLLDAIYYLCFTKSYFLKNDSNNVSFGESGFRIEGNFVRGGRNEQVACIVRENGRKEFLLNDDAYDKFSSHIGRLPCVMIAPDDIILITGGSEERRKYIDTIISQLDPDYLQNLINYNKVLVQRNSLLKSWFDNRNDDLLAVLDQQLTTPAKEIFDKRNDFLNDCIPVVRNFYRDIAGKEENVTLAYTSPLQNESMEQLLVRNRERDIAMQRTSSGIHRDDIEWKLDGQPFKTSASQGQRKSLLFALKLAEFELLKKHKGFAPILLLDDVFEKLDEDRMHNLLHWACQANSGQIFITDTHCERLTNALREMGVVSEMVSR